MCQKKIYSLQGEGRKERRRERKKEAKYDRQAVKKKRPLSLSFFMRVFRKPATWLGIQGGAFYLLLPLMKVASFGAYLF